MLSLYFSLITFVYIKYKIVIQNSIQYFTVDRFDDCNHFSCYNLKIDMVFRNFAKFKNKITKIIYCLLKYNDRTKKNICVGGKYLKLIDS